MPDELQLILAFGARRGLVSDQRAAGHPAGMAHVLLRPARRLQGARPADAVPRRLGGWWSPASSPFSSAAASDLLVIVAGAVGLAMVGTSTTAASGRSPRVSWSSRAAVVLWRPASAGRSSTRDGEPAAHELWVVGLVNAFNLMDNLDGAAGTWRRVQRRHRRGRRCAGRAGDRRPSCWRLGACAASCPSTWRVRRESSSGTAAACPSGSCRSKRDRPGRRSAIGRPPCSRCAPRRPSRA